MFRGIKRNTTDKLFSDIMRTRANFICERCHRDFSQRKEICDVSHFITRGNKRTRWDAENVCVFCRGCHELMGKNPGIYTTFMQYKLGLENYYKLMIRSERKLSDQKIDEKAIRMGLKLEWKRICERKKKEIIGAR